MELLEPVALIVVGLMSLLGGLAISKAQGKSALRQEQERHKFALEQECQRHENTLERDREQHRQRLNENHIMTANELLTRVAGARDEHEIEALLHIVAAGRFVAENHPILGLLNRSRPAPTLRNELERDLLKHPVSRHLPLIRVRIETRGVSFVALSVESLNAKANELYGLPQDSIALKNAADSDLYSRIEPWVNSENYKELMNDQKMVQSHFVLNKFAFARVPVRFNHAHPLPEFRGKEFLPAITEIRREKQEDGLEVHRAMVMYVDVSSLRTNSK